MIDHEKISQKKIHNQIQLKQQIHNEITQFINHDL